MCVCLFEDNLHKVVKQTNVRNKRNCCRLQGVRIFADFSALKFEDDCFNYLVVARDITPVNLMQNDHSSLHVVDPGTRNQKEGSASPFNSVLPVFLTDVILLYIEQKFVSLSLFF